MSVSFYCEKCHLHVEFDEAVAGGEVLCPTCRQSLPVPSNDKRLSRPIETDRGAAFADALGKSNDERSSPQMGTTQDAAVHESSDQRSASTSGGDAHKSAEGAERQQTPAVQCGMCPSAATWRHPDIGNVYCDIHKRAVNQTMEMAGAKCNWEKLLSDPPSSSDSNSAGGFRTWLTTCFSAKARRKRTERDKVFYCINCGLRRGFICSQCTEKLEREYQAVIGQLGIRDATKIRGLAIILASSFGRPGRKWEYCRWCGGKVPEVEDTCKKCGGEANRPTQQRTNERTK